MNELFVALRRRAHSPDNDNPRWESLGYYNDISEASDSIKETPADSDVGDIFTILSVDDITNISYAATSLRIVSKDLKIRPVYPAYDSETWFSKWEGDKVYLPSMIDYSVRYVDVNKVALGLADVLEVCNIDKYPFVYSVIEFVRSYEHTSLLESDVFRELLNIGDSSNHNDIKRAATCLLTGTVRHKLYEVSRCDHPFRAASIIFSGKLGRGSYKLGGAEAGYIFARSVTLTDVLLTNIDYESE